jgi:hypothetical protein
MIARQAGLLQQIPTVTAAPRMLAPLSRERERGRGRGRPLPLVGAQLRCAMDDRSGPMR